ncbi:MAG: Gfo/Idh/MocA family oxidoreductase [Tannerellaceae bacterium]|jgi:predicted dehydrogenase|nr:Gfo/Idh/MocA family oxidoreductase [Tannerellaceae bacterium]
MKKEELTRRGFLKSSVCGAIGTVSVPAFITGCTPSSKKDGSTQLKEVEVPLLPDKAPDGKPLKAGLVGCGSRGTGAVIDFLSAGDGLSIVAMGDVFEEKLATCRQELKGRGIDIPDDKCFLGFDAYQKVIDSDIDVVLLCTPPVFRPLHFEYAIKKGKHCFIEKPCAVDPVGARKILATAKLAEAKGLSIISGTVYRSQKDCVETYRRVAGGAIGQIISAHVIRHGGALWYIKRRPGWTDMEYMLRNWVNFCWTSGDHVVEQFIHEIDLMTWFMGDIHPVKAEATGGRQRRVTGDMYDFFSIEYIYESGIHTHCTSRQIAGCDNDDSILICGTKGYTNCFNTIYNPDGSVVWKYPYPKEEDADQSMKVQDPYITEHVRLVAAIRTNKPVNDVDKHVQSTLIAMMGRMSAYTGKFVSWDEVMTSTMKLGPETYAFGPVPGISEEIPVAGTAVK